MFLEISSIKKHFGEGESRVEVLKGIDISIEKGEICVLLGPSGSGKSTLLNIIGGIDNADSGYISINGEKTADMNEKTLTLYRRKHLGYIFQMYNLIPNLNIKENVEVGAYLSDHPLDVDDLLKTLGLYEHRHKLPNQLSGGQQQRTDAGNGNQQHAQQHFPSVGLKIWQNSFHNFSVSLWVPLSPPILKKGAKRPGATETPGERNSTLVQADLQRELLCRYSVDSSAELVHLVVVQKVHFSSSFLSYLASKRV